MPIPDSGDPGNLLDPMGLGEQKPAVLTDATWRHMTERFAELRELSDGGQAFVFEGKEKLKPHRRVAIKVYRADSDADRKLFEREVAIVGSTHLPRDLVVGFYSACRDDGIQPYLVLERIDGREPQDYVQTPEPLSMTRRIGLFETYCRAMQRLHDCNLVLRDVSIRNVLVESGDRVRFIDFAGAGLDQKGFENASMSVAINTPDSVPIEVLQGLIKASKQTDLFAAAGAGFHMLTGKAKGEVLNDAGITDENHTQAPQFWEAELTRCDVPGPIRKIVLKGLRKSDPRCDPNESPNLNLYSKVGQIADDIDAWKKLVVAEQQKADRRWQAARVAALMLIVALPGALGWYMWNQERQETSLVVSQRLIRDLQQQADELATREHVAVKKLLDDAGNSERRLADAPARRDPLSVRLQLADDVQAKLRQALDVGQRIERGSQQRAALGSVLLEEKVASKSEFWATGAPTIRQRLTDLQTRYVALGKRIDAGDVGDAAGESRSTLATELAELQRDLVALFEDNLLARQALQARASYEREKRAVSERVQKLEGFVLLHKTAQDGEQEFERGEFKSAVTNFGRATERLEEYLRQPGIETAEEKQNRQRATIGLVKVLETDKAQLLSRVAQLTGDVEAKVKLASEQQSQITQLEAKQLEDQVALKSMKIKLAAAESKVADLDQTLKQTTDSLADAVKMVAELEIANTTLQKRITESRNAATHLGAKVPDPPTSSPGPRLQDSVSAVIREIAELRGHDTSGSALIRAIAVSADGKFVAAVPRGAYLPASATHPPFVWDLATGQIAAKLVGYQPAGAEAVALSSNAKWVAGQGRDGLRKSDLSLWNVNEQNSSRSLKTLSSGDKVRGVRFSDSEKLLASVDDSGALVVWDVGTGKRLHEFQGAEGRPCFSFDDQFVAAAMPKLEVSVWDLKLSGLPKRFAFASDVLRSSKVRFSGNRPPKGGVEENAITHALRFSRDGRTLMAIAGIVGQPFTATAWDFETGKIIWSQKIGKQPTAAAIVPGENFSLLGELDGSLALWSLRDGTKLTETPAHDKQIEGIAVSEDGKTLVTGGADGRIHVFSVTYEAAENTAARDVSPTANAPEANVEAGGDGELTIEEFGLTVAGLTAESAKQLGVTTDAGVVVTFVAPNGPVARVPIFGRNSLITKVDQIPVKSMKDFRDAYKLRLNSSELVLHYTERSNGAATSRYTILRAKSGPDTKSQSPSGSSSRPGTPGPGRQPSSASRPGTPGPGARTPSSSRPSSK